MAEDQSDIIAWIKTNIQGKPRGIQTRLAEVLGLHPSMISKMLSGIRRIEADELLLMVKFFGSEPPAHGAQLPRSETEGTLLSPRASRGQVPMAGQIGEDKYWIEPGDSTADLQWVNGIVDEIYPIEEQVAYVLAHSTTDGEYKARDLIYTVPFRNYRNKPASGDEVVVERELDGFKIFSLRRAIPSDKGVILTPLHHQKKAPSPRETETIVGLVIGFYRPKRPA